MRLSRLSDKNDHEKADAQDQCKDYRHYNRKEKSNTPVTITPVRCRPRSGHNCRSLPLSTNSIQTAGGSLHFSAVPVIDDDQQGNDRHHASGNPENDTARGLVRERGNTEKPSCYIISRVKNAGLEGCKCANQNIEDDRDDQDDYAEGMRRLVRSVTCGENDCKEKNTSGQHRQMHCPVNELVDDGGIVDFRHLPDVQRHHKKDSRNPRAPELAIRKSDDPARSR